MLRSFTLTILCIAFSICSLSSLPFAEADMSSMIPSILDHPVGVAIESSGDTILLTEYKSSITSWDFEPVNMDPPWNRLPQYMYRKDATTDSSQYMIGVPWIYGAALITGAECYVYDGDSSYNLEMTLARKTQTYFETCNVAYSSGSSGNQTISIASNSCSFDYQYHDVTSADYSEYYIKINSPQVYATDSNNLRVYECSITFEI